MTAAHPLSAGILATSAARAVVTKWAVATKWAVRAEAVVGKGRIVAGTMPALPTPGPARRSHVRRTEEAVIDLRVQDAYRITDQPLDGGADPLPKDLFGKTAGDGGFILSSGVVLDEADPATCKALIEAGRKYGKT